MPVKRPSKTPPDLPKTLGDAHVLIHELARENKRLSDQLQVLLNRMYRAKSERLNPDQLLLFELGEQLAALVPDESQDDDAQDEQAKGKEKGRGKGHGRTNFPDHLPRIEEVLDLPEHERGCPECDRQMVSIGEEVTERGHVIPAQIVVKRTRRVKYACPDGHTVACPPLPPALIDRCKYEPSVYAHLAVSKYTDHVPLHRMVGIFKRHGFAIPKSTMWDMLVRVDELAAQPILAQCRRELLEQSLIQGDETPVAVRLEDQKGSKKAYVWVYLSGEIVVFDFRMTREGEGPSTFLRTWSGVFQADGYSGYDAIVKANGIERAGCWAHARRKLKEALDTGAHGAARLLRSVQRLYWIERALKTRRDARELSHEAFLELRLDIRRRRSAVVIERLKATWLEAYTERTTLPKSTFGAALTYLQNQWKPLTLFLEKPALEVDNNNAERALRTIALGRKNWMVFGSPRGGEVGCRLYSLLFTCQALGINPEAYLTDVLQRVSTTPATEIASLTPWAWAREQQLAAKVVDLQPA